MNLIIRLIRIIYYSKSNRYGSCNDFTYEAQAFFMHMTDSDSHIFQARTSYDILNMMDAQNSKTSCFETKT